MVAGAEAEEGVILANWRPRMSDFYDKTASLHHFIFQDWNKSIERQAGQLGGEERFRISPLDTKGDA